MLVTGEPPQTLLPEHRTDLAYAHRALYEFIAAFSAGRHVVVVGEQAVSAAPFLRNAGAASVVGVVRQPWRRAYAARNFGTGTVRFAERVPSTPHDVIAFLSSADGMEVGDTDFVIVIEPPDRRPVQLPRYTSVRRFQCTSTVRLDFGSVLPAKEQVPRSFTIDEVADGTAVAADTIAVITVATREPKWSNLRVHIGSGPVVLPGWVNVDNLPYPNVDFLWDVSRGLPFRQVSLIFAEHLLEHLPYEDALQFLRTCRAALKADGVLRLSTPNLDWVWSAAYHHGAWASPQEAIRDCFVTNRAFHGWGHRFLYNFPTLEYTLRAAGFGAVVQRAYGQSEIAELNALERHPPSPDIPGIPHVVIVEASGHSHAADVVDEPMVAEYLRDVAVK